MSSLLLLEVKNINSVTSTLQDFCQLHDESIDLDEDTLLNDGAKRAEREERVVEPKHIGTRVDNLVEQTKTVSNQTS